MVNSQFTSFMERYTRRFQTESAVLSRRTTTTNVLGAPEIVYEDYATVTCRIILDQARRGEARNVAEREALVDVYRISLPAGTEIGDDCRVTVGGVVYEVVGVLDARTDENDVQVRATRAR